MSLRENAFLTSHRRKKMLQSGFIRFTQRDDYTRQIVEQCDVKCASDESAASSLSGGNLQKFIVGREVLQQPEVLVVSQPTWGVDAGAAQSIHTSLAELADAGAAVLVISQDLDELLAISDRIAALCAGELSPSRATHEVSVEQLGLLMGGVHNTDSGSEATAVQS